MITGCTKGRDFIPFICSFFRQIPFKFHGFFSKQVVIWSVLHLVKIKKNFGGLIGRKDGV